MYTSPPSTTSLQLVYTAPGSPDLGQQRASLQLDGSPVTIIAVCRTEIVLHHPEGETLQVSPALTCVDANSQFLALLLPAEEGEFDLRVTAQQSGAAGTIKVTTKRERIKPDRPLRASFE